MAFGHGVPAASGVTPPRAAELYVRPHSRIPPQTATTCTPHTAMTSLHEYESWLDELDKKLYIKGDQITVEFDIPISFELRSCLELEDIKAKAATLRQALAKNSTSLPRKYLIERFIRLVVEANRLSISRDEIVEQLMLDWNIEDEFTDF